MSLPRIDWSVCESLGLLVQESQRELLEFHLKEIQQWNPRLHLVSPGSEPWFVRHTLDSLVALAPIRERVATLGRDLRGCDVGTGAGFPGFVLSVMEPGWHLDLLERSANKGQFLKRLVRQRDRVLKEIFPEAPVGRLRLLTQELRNVPESSYDWISFRAFAPLSRENWAEIRRILKPGGLAFAYKGRKETLATEIPNLSHWGDSHELLDLEVPDLGEERNLLVVKKNELVE